MAKHDLVIRIAGESGEGVISTGELITLAAARAGFFIFTYRTYPAEIKGGHAVFQLRLSDHPVYSQGDDLDILLAFNQEGYDRHHEELHREGILIYDTGTFSEKNIPFKQLFGLPLSDIAKNQIHMPLSKNVVAVGALSALFSIPNEVLEPLLRAKFERKGGAVLQKNLEALATGRTYVEQNFHGIGALKVFPKPRGKKLVLSGNEAIALGAIVAGCREYFGYPITPASDIMEFLAAEFPKIGGTVMQAEDEIAAITMAIGASYAGKKVMTASSGPGIALMTEALGLASMAELPLVVADIQRAGPSTGLPTKHEQSDLNLAVYGNHGEAPRIVLSPMNVADCFYRTIDAFNLAEQYQVPVLLVSDTALATRSECIDKPDLAKIKRFDRVRAEPLNGEPYKRYEFSPSGVSPMSVPGDDGLTYTATGLEHDEEAHPNYTPAMHSAMMDKRFRKVKSAIPDFPKVEILGAEDSPVGIIGWGSTLGAIREAVETAAEKGIKIQSFYPRVLHPLGDGYLTDDLKRVKKLIVAEVNATGQFANLLAPHYRGEVERLNIYGGQPFKSRMILNKIEEVCHHG